MPPLLSSPMIATDLDTGYKGIVMFSVLLDWGMNPTLTQETGPPPGHGQGRRQGLRPGLGLGLVCVKEGRPNVM